MSRVDDLAPFILDGVSVVSEEQKDDHCGSYGFVFEVKIGQIVYIAKKPHLYFMKNVSELEKNAIITKFREECLLLSNLRHPNIVQFVGVHYGPRGRDDISLVMERLVCDLAAFLEDNKEVDKMTKLMIIQDVSYGLVYLHEYNPTIIHRDLTARNILLTQDCRGKIADVGMAKLMDERARQAKAHTQIPGQVYYMPPEARKRKANYTSKLDIFSFGHLSLHTVIGDYPVLYEDDITPEVIQQGTTEIAKRQVSLDTCKSGDLQCLYPSIVNCLMDNPEQRPSARDMNKQLNHLVLEVTQREKLSSLVTENKLLKSQLSDKNHEIADIQENLQETVKEKNKMIEENSHAIQCLAEEKKVVVAEKIALQNQLTEKCQKMQEALKDKSRLEELLHHQAEELSRAKQQILDMSAQVEQEKTAALSVEKNEKTSKASGYLNSAIPYYWRNGLYDLKTIKCGSRKLKGIYCFQCDENKIISGHQDHTVKIWERKTLLCQKVLEGHTGSVHCLQYDDNVIITGSGDSTVRIWDIHTGNMLNTLTHHTDRVLYVKFVSNVLVTTSRDCTIAVWDMKTPTNVSLTQILKGHKGSVHCVEFDEKRIISASSDKSILIWRRSTGKVIQHLHGHKGNVWCFHCRGKYLVSGSSDRAIGLWDIDVGILLRLLEGHCDYIKCIKFDDKIIVSGCHNGSIKMWDFQAALDPHALQENICFQTLNDHEKCVNMLQFDDRELLSCSKDGTILIRTFSGSHLDSQD